MPQFHETGYGKKFFDMQLPKLIKSIDRLAEATEKNIEKQNHIAFKEYGYTDKEAILHYALKASGLEQSISEAQFIELNDLLAAYLNNFTMFIKQAAVEIIDEYKEIELP